MDMDIDMDIDLNAGKQAANSQEGGVSVHNPRNMMVMQLSIVIDAANVCWSYLRSLPGFAYAELPPRFRPPLHGLLLCLQFFQSHGVRPVAVCPAWWNYTEKQGVWKDAAFEQEDFGIFKRLRTESTLFCAPAGDHDDLYVIDYAFRTNGYIVTNDKFRDHSESRGLSTKYVENRTISFMWINNEFIPNPDDISRLRMYLLKREQPNVPAYTVSIPNATQIVSQHGSSNPPQPPLQHQQHIQQTLHTTPFPASNSMQGVESESRFKSQAAVSMPPTVPSGMTSLQSLDGRSTLRIQVPTGCVKFIIGRGGSKIQQLEQVSGK